VNYFDTYLFVSRITSILILIVITTIIIHQMDVKITLLNGDLDKEVYMKQSDRFVINGQEKFVSLLNHYIV